MQTYIMPVWTEAELRLCVQQRDLNLSDVEINARFKSVGGSARLVLGKEDPVSNLEKAILGCEPQKLVQLITTDPATLEAYQDAGKHIAALVHLTTMTDDGAAKAYETISYQYASPYAQNLVVDRIRKKY